MSVEKQNKPLTYSQEKGFWVGLTANIRLSENDHVHLDSYELSEELMDALTPVFNKRYGPGCWEYSIDEQIKNNHNEARIKGDSSIIRARLKTKNFAPNKPVDLSFGDDMNEGKLIN